MANSFLSPTAITREFLAVLHQKCTFISSINRQYDDRFANSGATMSGKVGPTLTIRKPNRYTIRTGAQLQTQDVPETGILLTQATQKGIDMTFTSQDLTLTIDEFSQRYIQPAAAALAATLEADAFSCVIADSGFGTVVGSAYTDDTPGVSNHAMGIANLVGTPNGGGAVYKDILNARQRLNFMLAPWDNRNGQLGPVGQVGFLSDTKGLFNNQTAIGKQYTDGMLGQVAGLNFYENPLTPTVASGTRSQTGVTLSAAVAEGSNQVALTGLVSSGTVNAGEVFTIANVYAVHPETRARLPYLQPFTVLAPVTASSGAATVTVWPTVRFTSGPAYPYQNVNAQPASSAAVSWISHTAASQTNSSSLIYHRDAFALVSADLVLPNGVDFAARAQSDGVSVRLVRAYDINTDRFPTRIDVMYGIRTLRPHLAVRVTD